jgi:DNA-directed RNA polymerase specialized sigma24 family protein
MNYTDAEILETITNVAAKLAPKYTFGYYGVDDIRQEAIMMGYEALPRYDNKRPLENFIYVHINNRLKTFKRDNYFRINAGSAESIQQAKKNIMDPVSIEKVEPLKDSELLDSLHINEIRERINKHLPANLRKDYLRICSGAKVSKNTRQKIVDALKQILENYE